MPMPYLSLKLGCSSPQVQLVWPGYIFRKETKNSHQVYILLYFTLICQLDLIENRKQLLIFTKIVRAPAWFVSLGVSLNIRRNQPGMKFTNSIFLNHNKVMLRRPATSQWVAGGHRMVLHCSTKHKTYSIPIPTDAVHYLFPWMLNDILKYFDDNTSILGTLYCDRSKM